MDKIISYLPAISVCVGIWAVANGVLHDVFVLLSEHGKKYDRTLLRLLMDGHILITCGLVQILSYPLLKNNNPTGYYLVLMASVSLLIYCAMIFPFLKSIGMMAINISFIFLLCYVYISR